ncbi:ComEC/Rec2 family competence protein [uncultured Ruthenibacterium sp.]|uniref:ComEC/Rec2 family competence protein n=1 Tax=uncultured Ruthenibacterium sp. TaxID=1905347 RepID=UPI00349E95FE
MAVPATADDAKTKIHFIDVGQADATLLEQNGFFALIDAGEADTQTDLIDYLHEVGVEKLEYLIMTHPHSDHIGGMRAVLDTFEVNQVLLPNFDKAPVEWWPSTERLMERINEQKNPAIVMQTGDIYPLGEGNISVLMDGIQSDNANNLSPILRFEVAEFRFLIEGDAEKEIEETALERNLDIRASLFKAGHHGSATSNTEPFVQMIAPQYVIISCGQDNSYGHPHEEVLEIFEETGSRVFRTDQNGTIVAYVDQEQKLQIAVADVSEDLADVA